MGAALAASAVEMGHEVIVVSGPVQVTYPNEVTVIPVVTTQEMLETACKLFPACDGAIGAAAPCDYQPGHVATQKISKTGEPVQLHLVETPDVIATLGQQKRADQWVVGFALETEDRHFRAIVKLERKLCDLMVSNGPEAIDADCSRVDLLDRRGTILARLEGSKSSVAKELMREITGRLVLHTDRAS